MSHKKKWEIKTAISGTAKHPGKTVYVTVEGNDTKLTHAILKTAIHAGADFVFSLPMTKAFIFPTARTAQHFAGVVTGVVREI